MTQDPRLDVKLPRSAILTDTRVRLSFLPDAEPERIITAEKEVPQTRLLQMAPMMRQGKVHIQIKAGFADERSLVLTPAELLILTQAADQFLTELPA